MKDFKLLIPVLAAIVLSSCGNRKCEQAVFLPLAEPDSLELAYAPGFELGQNAMDFVLTAPDSTEFNLSDYAGKIVVLDFWATWCGDCRAEVPAMKELYAEYKDKKICGDEVEFVGVSFDNDAERWRSFIAENEMEWPQGCNFVKWKENPVSEAYGIHWIPTMVIVCPEGRILDFALTTERLRLKLEAMSKRFN